jgi:YbgC/YbaW family acyl-CoA thioester hydrolase
MPYEFKVTRRVEFSETDMAGIMHFSNFFRFMETAEHGFMRSLGYSVVLKELDPFLCLPRVHASCDYLAPLRFEDEVEIHLLVERKTTRSLTYRFRFRHADGRSSQDVALGSLIVVCAVRQPDGTLKATPLPSVLAQQIQEAPQALLGPPRKQREKPIRTHITDS